MPDVAGQRDKVQLNKYRLSGQVECAATLQFTGRIVQPVGFPVQVMAYARYPDLMLLNVRMVKHAATPNAGYPGGGMQQPRVARGGFAPTEFHIVHCLADEPVTGRRQVFPDLDLCGVGAQVLSIAHCVAVGSGV